ncbi:MAG: hypothetical protein WBN81_09980 [Gammaproteobacteria bacterium]
MAVELIPIDRDTPYIFPPSVQDYLPDDHLAHFVVDIVEQLDVGQSRQVNLLLHVELVEIFHRAVVQAFHLGTVCPHAG